MQFVKGTTHSLTALTKCSYTRNTGRDILDHTKHYRLSSPQAQARGVHWVTGVPDTVTTAYIKLSNYRTN